MEEQRFQGACLCEAVRFMIKPPTKWCAHCHCSLCQRAHGAPLVTWVGVDLNQFELDDDADLQWFSSSSDARRGFCKRCGSTLFFQSSRWPGEIHIARACIAGDIDRHPEAHVFAAARAHWFDFSDELPWKT